MINTTTQFRLILLPIAIIVLGCFVAYSATNNTRWNALYHHPATSTKDTSSKFIQVIHADVTTADERDNKNLMVLEGNVVLQQGKTIFKANKAIKDNIQNTFEAWGKVHINDADTTNIYSDHLKYIGNTQIANLDGNVKLTDGQVTLTTPALQYDMTTNIGIYNQGGKVINKKTIITSKEGEYYRDIQDVYFKKNVLVNDPTYNIQSDSLKYNTGTQVATFITMTHIKDSAGRSIDTKEGYYNLKTGQAEFGQRPFINDNNKSTLKADKVYLDNNIAKAEGNAIAVDSIRGTIIIANLIFQNRVNEAILATNKPVMIIKQDNDSIYIAADTLFSAKLSELYETPLPTKDLDTTQKSISATNDSTISTPNIATHSTSDTTNKKANVLIPRVNTDTLVHNLQNDSTTAISTIKSAINITEKEDSIVAITKKDTLATNQIKNLAPPTIQKNIAQTIPVKDSLSSATKKDTKTIASTFEKPKNASNDSTDRYFEAFHNVRIFSDSMQAVSDSLFYSFKDSTFRLYKRPVVWGKESQITGDTILLHTKNKQPKWMEAFRNGFMVNYIGKDAYNQVKASRIDAYFFESSLDSVRAKGSAECIYYLQDDDSAFTGVNQNSCDIIDSYFQNKQLHKVAFRSNVKGTIYPIRQKKPSEMKLEGFIWREGERPKNKYELFE